MGFDGFPEDTVAYLRALRKNNSREWFEAHRDDYRRCFAEPALGLIEALLPAAESLDPPHRGEARLNGSLRRINRDVRFSKDKRPYNPRIHMIFWTGDHPNRSSGIHLVMGPDGFGYGAGHWAFEPEALSRYRAAVMDAGKRAALEAALAKARSVGCDLDEPQLKTVPRGFDGEAPGAELLRHKGIVARTLREEDGHDRRLFTADCAAYCGVLMRALAPLDKWLCEQVESR